MTPTTAPPLPSQEELDYEALRAYLRLKSYTLVAKQIHCTRSTAFERVQRAVERAKPNSLIVLVRYLPD